jgi:hypothetical protein
VRKLLSAIFFLRKGMRKGLKEVAMLVSGGACGEFGVGDSFFLLIFNYLIQREEKKYGRLLDKI